MSSVMTQLQIPGAERDTSTPSEVEKLKMEDIRKSILVKVSLDPSSNPDLRNRIGRREGILP